MDRDRLQKQLQNSKIREGTMLKRSKFLKQWRERWVVLTFNYIFTFTNSTYKEVTDIMDLKTVKSYKSYVSKSEEMIPASFKIRSGQSALYLCAKSTQEKWSWIVSIERLLDYKQLGASSYNNVSFLKTKGFPSLDEFMNPKLDMSDDVSNFKAILKNAEKKKDELERQSVEIAKKMFIEQEQIRRQKQNIERQKNRIKMIREELQRVRDKNSSQIGQLPSSVSSFSQSKGQSQQFIKVQSSSPSKQNIVEGIFQQFHPESSDYFAFKYFVDFIILIASDSRLEFQGIIMKACKNHENRGNFGQIFIQIFTEYQPTQSGGRVSLSFSSTPMDTEYLCNLLKFINLIFDEKVESIFKINDIQILSHKLRDLLLLNQSDSTDEIGLLLEAMRRINMIKKYEKGEIEQRLIKIMKLSKKQSIAKEAKDLLKML